MRVSDALWPVRGYPLAAAREPAEAADVCGGALPSSFGAASAGGDEQSRLKIRSGQEFVPGLGKLGVGGLGQGLSSLSPPPFLAQKALAFQPCWSGQEHTPVKVLPFGNTPEATPIHPGMWNQGGLPLGLLRVLLGGYALRPSSFLPEPLFPPALCGLPTMPQALEMPLEPERNGRWSPIPPSRRLRRRVPLCQGTLCTL